MVASRVFAVPASEVTPAMRSKAKMVGYGLSYGMEAFGLASRLGISIGEATEILNGFFASFPKVKSFMDETILRAKTNGFTETEFGRRRHLPDLHAANRQIRLAAERQAMNAPIQGLAADIFKVALVNLDRTLMKKSLNSTIVLQVHDEIVLEVGKPELDEVQAIVESEMTSAYQLSVDLKVHIGWGDSWSSAKSN
jgi:DNA polymerase-1